MSPPVALLGSGHAGGCYLQLFVLVPSALNANPDYIHFSREPTKAGPPSLFLDSRGLPWCCSVLGKKRGSFHAGSFSAFGGCTVLLAIAVATLFVAHIPGYLKRVSPGGRPRADLGCKNKIPPNAEVVASQGVMGRFSAGLCCAARIGRVVTPSDYVSLLNRL